MALVQIEKRLESIVEGTFARIFRTQLRPVELSRRMIRELDMKLTLGIHGERICPNHVTVTLAQLDYDRFASFATSLAAELANKIEEHALSNRLVLKGPAMVDLMVSGTQRGGQFKLNTLIKVAPREAAAQGWLTTPENVGVAIVEHAPVVLGRLPECDIVISDTKVSRRHCEVRIVDGLVRVVDLSSANGTRLNGRGVPSDDFGLALTNGDEIKVGAVIIRFTTSKSRV